MNRCPFCNLDTSIYYNEIIDETDNFRIVPCIGSLVDGYVLVLPKKHVYCMTSFSADITEEYNNILKKYRNIFKKIYGKYPIVFEHGTPDPCGICANCVIHGHTHIVNHNYKNENEIINKLRLKTINNIFDIEKKKNYIYYMSPKGKEYVTYDFEPISQIMRIFIARDLGIEKEYNWRLYPFDDNIKSTIKKLKENNIKE